MGKAVLALAGVVATLGLLEVTLRVLDLPKPVTARRPAPLDPALKGLPALSGGIFSLVKPNLNHVFKGQAFRTNSAGFRGPEYPKRPGPNTFRTVLIGDSVTMGSGVAQEDTYGRYVQQKLNAQDDGRRYEVLNLGVGGFNLHASVGRLKGLGLRYAPDLIVYGWTANDIEGPAYRRTHTPKDRAVSALRLVRWLGPRWDGFRELIYPVAGSYIHQLDENYFRNPEAWSFFLNDLDELKSIADRKKVCAVMFMHTSMLALNSLHPFHRYYRAVQEAAEERGIFVIPSYSYFHGRDPADYWLHSGDLHPNPAGHRILADALFDGLQTLPAECGLAFGRKAKAARVAGVSNAGKSGKGSAARRRVAKVEWIDPSATYDGYTLIVSPGNKELYWVDMKGEVALSHLSRYPVGHVEQLVSGGLVIHSRAIVDEYSAEGKRLARFEAGGDAFHHDAIMTKRGTLLGITHALTPEPKMWADRIIEKDRDGNLLWSWDALDHLDPEHNPPNSRSHEWLGERDWLHCNSVDEFSNGDVLLSIRNHNRIVRIDRDTGEIVWSWGPGILAHQHSVKLLENGNITMFDNGIYRDGEEKCDPTGCLSRALEMDPRTGEVVWEYSLPGHFSQGFGDVDRLPNGNTLITYGQRWPRAKIVEVTPEGEVVWQLVSLVPTNWINDVPMLYRAQRVTTLPVLPRNPWKKSD